MKKLSAIFIPVVVLLFITCVMFFGGVAVVTVTTDAAFPGGGMQARATEAKRLVVGRQRRTFVYFVRGDSGFRLYCRGRPGNHDEEFGYVTRGNLQIVHIVVENCAVQSFEARTFP